MKSVVPLPIAADHAAFAGHFVGDPIVPGVVLLDEALHAIARLRGTASAQCDIAAAKFLSSVRPGEPLQLSLEPSANGGIRFAIHASDRLVASGLLSAAPPAGRANGG